jgi:integrase/recombinase XerC
MTTATDFNSDSNSLVTIDDQNLLNNSLDFSSLSSIAATVSEDVWTDFLKLHVSPNTKRTYSAAIDDFFGRLMNVNASPERIREFLVLPDEQALGVVLKYKTLLLEAKLAPSTINTRLSALKSLVDHARKLKQCGFTLADVKQVRVEKYRDTAGVGVDGFRSMLATVDRSTFKGKRDYAILRLLWDNALRRGELVAANVGDFRDGQLWIVGKGKLQKCSIDLATATVMAVREWLAALRLRSVQVRDDEPLFIAVDTNTFGKRLSGRSVARLVAATSLCDGNGEVNPLVGKRMSPHKVRHSSITTFLDASNGDVRTAQRLSRHSRLDTLMIYDDNRQGLQGKASIVLADLV